MSQLIATEQQTNHSTLELKMSSNSISPSANWTDGNKKVLLDVLQIVADGRFTNMSNKKAKWTTAEDMYNSSTGWLSTNFLLSFTRFNICFI